MNPRPYLLCILSLAALLLTTGCKEKFPKTISYGKEYPLEQGVEAALGKLNALEE